MSQQKSKDSTQQQKDAVIPSSNMSSLCHRLCLSQSIFPLCVTGCVYHRVYVLWQPETVSQENQEKPQDHECQGQSRPQNNVQLLAF